MILRGLSEFIVNLEHKTNAKNFELLKRFRAHTQSVILVTKKNIMQSDNFWVTPRPVENFPENFYWPWTMLCKETILSRSKLSSKGSGRLLASVNITFQADNIE